MSVFEIFTLNLQGFTKLIKSNSKDFFKDWKTVVLFLYFCENLDFFFSVFKYFKWKVQKKWAFIWTFHLKYLKIEEKKISVFTKI